jgi:DNA segregation ATPase FtsK/SpoIIIE-like protein
MPLSSKSEAVARLLDKVEARWQPPSSEPSTLVELALLCVLVRTVDERKAKTAISALQQAFPDWNEVRVCQVQEIAAHLAVEPQEKALRIARDLRECLQEIFQRNHGYDLEFMREDAVAAGKFVASLNFIGSAAGHYLMWIAGGKNLPVSPALVRLLDRLGVAERSGSIKKARGAIEPIVPKGRELEFALRFGDVIDRWCHPQKPLCPTCILVNDCAFGRRAFKEWKLQQQRAEQSRKKDEARREVQRQKDDARRSRDAERERKRLEAEAAKQARDREKRQREDAIKKAAEQKLAAQKAENERRKAENAAREKAKAEAAVKRQREQEQRTKQREDAERKRQAQLAARAAKEAKDAAKLAAKQAKDAAKLAAKEAEAKKRAQQKAAAEQKKLAAQQKTIAAQQKSAAQKAAKAKTAAKLGARPASSSKRAGASKAAGASKRADKPRPKPKSKR